MSNLDNNSKIKLGFLQFRYKYLSDVILKLEKHIDYLYINNNIDVLFKNQILSSIFNISKNIIITYNNYILHKLESVTQLDFILDIFQNSKCDDELFKQITYIIKNNPLYLPLYEEEKSLKIIIGNIGFPSLLELIIIYDMKDNLSVSQLALINEIDKLFIPTKINIFQVSNHIEDYYWRKPSKFSESDILELNRELWIKNINNEYIKIEGYFINDTISCVIKTCQINYPIIYKLKEDFYNKLNQTQIDTKFVKKFIRYNYLGNIYTLSSVEYINLLKYYYKQYLSITQSSFVTIMKDFISKGSDIKIMYDYIFLLLLGTNDNADVASLLFGLIKEKKMNSPHIYNLLSQRLPYYLLVKIKNSSNNLKQELTKLKTLSHEDINIKNQLITNKYIPESVKIVTLEKIEEMALVNNEYYKQQIFVKHILNYPWPTPQDDIIYQNINSDSTESTKYLTEIENKLVNLSYGHKEAKKNLLQIIGQWITNPQSKGTSFGFQGPPGVGKTLLAKSVSKALNIPFSEITLGGQNDGEILHGHGYTYSGSQPGLIIKKMVEMGKQRCILYFDELDKSCSKHGSINEITSILIHLTDPNMNKTFQDRFFQGIDFPLDKVIMIFSYNDANLVDPILLDRLKQIEMDAYTITDKIQIVKEFIIPEIAESVGLLHEPWIHISNDLIEYIIDNYTNEAGVRSIKRKIEQIFLTLNLDKIYKRNDFTNNNFNEITKDIIIKILDKPGINTNTIHSTPLVGIINGLYATSSNGGIIPIQIFNNFDPNLNRFEIKLTGKQGDVMKESVYCSLTAAIEYIKKNINKYPNINNLDKYLLTHFKNGFHVHAPATSTPKDGPSAGCAFTSAFISRILNRPIKNNIAMTGEIELTGKITKIGGLHFKLLGAKKAGVKTVYVPKDNMNDIDDIKIKYPTLFDNLELFNITFFEYIDEIIDDILV
jgi:endopeptidase La